MLELDGDFFEKKIECVGAGISGGEPPGAHETGGAPYRGAPSFLVGASATSWLALQVLWITFVPKIMLPKVSFRLDSV